MLSDLLVLFMVTCHILKMSLLNRSDYFHFSDKDTKAQERMCDLARPSRWQKQVLKLDLSDLNVHIHFCLIRFY